MAKKDSLSVQQRVEIFCQAIIEGENQSDAYRQAYPASANWKAKTVHSKASEFAKKGEVKDRLAELGQRALNVHDTVIAKIMTKLQDVAFFDPKDLFTEGGAPRKIKDLPDNVRAAFGHIEVDGDGNFKVKQIDPLKAVEMIGKFYAIWTENHQHGGIPGGRGIPVQPLNPISAEEMAKQDDKTASESYMAMIRATTI